MKKILVAFDGSFYSESALQYAIQIAKKTEALISGIFLEDLTAYHQFSPVFHAPEMIGLADDVLLELKNENKQTIQENIDKFTQQCNKAEARYTIEKEAGIPAKELIDESLYADLLIIGSVTYFSNISFATDQNLISDLLYRANCPVVVVPERFDKIRSVVLTFDGSTSSVWAIKLYTYLFRDFLDDQTLTLLSVCKKEDESVEGERRLHHYLQQVQPNCKYEKIVGKPVDEILHFAKVSGNSMLVMGSHGRNAFWKLFKSSVEDKIVKARTIPVFVAHE